MRGKYQVSGCGNACIGVGGLKLGSVGAIAWEIYYGQLGRAGFEGGEGGE